MPFLSAGSSWVSETSSSPDFEVLFCWMCSASLLYHETPGFGGLSLGSFQGFRVPVFYPCRQPIGLVWFPSFDGEGWPLHAACSSGKDGQVVPLSFPVLNAWRVLLPTQWTCLAEAHLLLIWIKHHKVTEDTKMMFPTAVLVWALCRKGLGLTRVEYSEKMLLKHFRLELCWVCITG